MWNLERNATNELTKKKETHRLRKQTYGCWEEGIVRDFGKVMYTLLYLKWITDVTCQPGREVGGGRMDTCVCMAESLPCSPETTTTLLIGSTPVQNVFVV